MLQFIFLHEIAHIVLGHVAWLDSEYGISIINEVDPTPLPDNEYANRQVLEADADRQAATWTSGLIDYAMKSNPDWRYTNDADLFHDIGYIYAALFMFLDAADALAISVCEEPYNMPKSCAPLLGLTVGRDFANKYNRPSLNFAWPNWQFNVVGCSCVLLYTFSEKLMINLADVMDTVCQKATLSRPYVFDLKTVVSARESSLSTHKARVSSNGGKYELAFIDNGQNVTATYALGPLKGLAATISRVAFAATQYGRVAENELFKLLYDVRSRALSYIGADGATAAQFVDSCPCMICGLVLPLRNITIDHQRPQTGGELEAVLKVFRAFGLTTEGPKGPKGQRILAHLTNGTALSPVGTLPGRAPLPAGNLNDRYTLSEHGTILYSFISDAGQLPTLRSECMHSVCNLKPACQACNSSRGNPLKFP